MFNAPAAVAIVYPEFGDGQTLASLLMILYAFFPSNPNMYADSTINIPEILDGM